MQRTTAKPVMFTYVLDQSRKQSTNHNLALAVKPKGEIWSTRFPGIEVLRSFEFSELRGNRKEKITREPTD